MLIDLDGAIEKAVHVLTQYNSKKISLFHHNDTDGICSGSILLTSFLDCGYDIERYSLEKPYPQVLSKIFSLSGQIVIFADFAGKIAPLISELNNKKNLVIIIDHHPAEDTDDSSVININGSLFGLKGDRDISASSTSFLFADALLKSKELDAGKLSHLGVLGAIGDGFFVDGALAGVNKDILSTAVQRGLIRVTERDGLESYFIRIGNNEYPSLRICESIDILGGVGYYDKGPELAMELCLKGMTSDIEDKINFLKSNMDKIFAAELENLKSGLKTTEHIQWFNVGDRFKPMGVKMVGVFCMHVKDLDFLDENKYLAGFQNVPDKVPGFGAIQFNSSKISMRVSRSMTEKIRSGEAPGLNSFLPEATYRLGGFVDACHGLSAATTVVKGNEELLIIEMEKELAKGRSVNGNR